MNLSRALALLCFFASCYHLYAGALDVTVKNVKGAFVSDAVVYAIGPPNAKAARKQAIIDQRDKQFLPYVTALQVGTSVLFPNSDNIRRHVYSFSPAKKFELPLYAGVSADPVLFDKAGCVTLGCNIHDWMIAYVAVLTTPYYQITGRQGRAHLKDLPAGQYRVEVWQPSLKGAPEKSAQRVALAPSGVKELLFTLDLKTDLRAKRAPELSTGGYR